jgi:hypothetical protein
MVALFSNSPQSWLSCCPFQVLMYQNFTEAIGSFFYFAVGIAAYSPYFNNRPLGRKTGRAPHRWRYGLPQHRWVGVAQLRPHWRHCD